MQSDAAVKHRNKSVGITTKDLRMAAEAQRRRTRQIAVLDSAASFSLQPYVILFVFNVM